LASIKIENTLGTVDFCAVRHQLHTSLTVPEVTSVGDRLPDAFSLFPLFFIFAAFPARSAREN